MIQDRKSKKGAAAGLIFAAVVLVLVVLLENLSSLLPSVPAVLQPTSQLFTVLKKGAVYSLVAVSMNLLNGFTGLFSLGQAGFMLLGAYTYAILTVPVSAKDSVYYLYGGSAVPFSLPDLFGGVDTPAGLILGVLLAILLRFMGQMLSGVIFFSQNAWDGWGAWGYSITYHLSCKIPEGIATTAILLALPLNTIKNAIGGSRR